MSMMTWRLECFPATLLGFQSKLLQQQQQPSPTTPPPRSVAFSSLPSPSDSDDA